MESIKISFSSADTMQVFNVELDKLIYILSKLENNKNLKYKNQEQIENLMKKHSLYDEHFLKNINKL